MKHIAIVYGTRPQVIKLAPLAKELDKHKDQLAYSLINTGQHYDENMDGVFHKQLGIKSPVYRVEVKGNVLHNPPKRLGTFIAAVSDALRGTDLVIVIGDTDSTLAGALAANKMGIPVAHIEAGVRSGDYSQPEEINRILVDEISVFHFVPDKRDIDVQFTEFSHLGCDLMLDAFLMYKDKAVPPDGMDITGMKFNLLTLHRANITGKFINEVIKAIEFIDIPTLWPVHPRIIKLIPNLAKLTAATNIALIEPTGYFEMLWLVQNANHILTDSGGLVREAGFAGKPCTILRTESEWRGYTIKEYSALSVLNTYGAVIDFPEGAKNIKYGAGWLEAHGNGKAAETITNALIEYLK